MNVKSIVLLASMWLAFSHGVAQDFIQVTYEPDGSNFPNPERGIYHHKEVRSVAYTNLQKDELVNYRSQGATLIMRVFYLESFVDRDISAEYLDNMRRDFAIARETGIKLLVRFAYTQRISPPVGDAEPSWVLAHIEQLKDVLMQNSDVIALVQAGFIGAWGEWHYTDHFSQVVGFINEQNWMDRTAVVNALLDAIPLDRTVQLRTPTYKRRITGVNEALSEAEAFSGTDRARLGHHNDCFLASPNDVGTYVNVAEEKNYIEQETFFVPLGGETCGVYIPRSECPSAISEMERLHWSYMNVDYHPLVIDGFQDGGCMPDIERKLGYRYRLTEGSFQTDAAPSSELKVEVKLINDGWANPYNPRYVEFVLHHTVSGKEYFFRTIQDPRRWPVTDVINIANTIGLPADIEEGDYALYLNLPDPRTSLYGNPNYSIRLANQQVWDATKGYNDLNMTINVDDNNDVPVYAGSDFFTMRNALDPALSTSPILSSGSASNVLLYWGATDSEAYRVIQRSIDNTTFETIAILDGTQTSFSDQSVVPGTRYYYRSYAQADHHISAFSPISSVDTKLQDPDFQTFNSNGELQEWAIVAPVATRYSDDKTITLRLFADRDSLNILLEGVENKLYQVYLDTDENAGTGIIDDTWTKSGFDYCVRNDSLFHAQGQSWSFVSNVFSSLGAGGLEVSVSLGNLVNLGDNFRINVAASIRTAANAAINLPAAGKSPATYIRIQPASTPTSFKVSNSQSIPESRLVIEWQNECLNCTGVVVERSDNSDTGFQEIFRTNNALIFRNDGLEVNKTYYYRIYSFNETGISPYSSVMSGTTHATVTAVETIDRYLNVYPVPVSDVLTIQSERRIEMVTIHGAIGHVFGTKEMERNEGHHDVKVNVAMLPSGIYILWVHFREKKIPCKILKK
jgi:hypothetical protein